MNHPRAVVVASFVALSLALGVAMVTWVSITPSASAHAGLVKITPAANARLSTAPARVVVEFNEPVIRSFATVVVTSADGVSVAGGTPSVSGGTVSKALRPGMLSGSYRIAYRVTSDDGHPVTGESRFTLTLTSSGGPAKPVPSTSPDLGKPSVSAPASASAAKSKTGPDSRLTSYVSPILGSVVLLAIGAALLSWRRRRH